MCNSVDKYIRQVIPEPWFSPTLTKAFSANAIGDLECKFDYMNEGARLIHLHSVTLFMSNGSLVTPDPTLIDNFGNKLMVFNKSVFFGGIFPFDFVINSGQIKLTLTNSASTRNTITMTAMFQFIKDKPTR